MIRKLIDPEAYLARMRKTDVYPILERYGLSDSIRTQEAAQPEPKTGHWIDMGDFEQCSVCTGTQLKVFQTYYGKAIWMRTPYCPNCGARMRKDQNDEE